MQPQGDKYTHARERALADGIREVASELRLIDITDFIAYIRFEKFGNISNLVASATELYFKPGTIRFGKSGDVEAEWGHVPSIKLDMEFQHKNVRAQFRLVLDEMVGGVEMHDIVFSDGSDEPERNTDFLISAIQDARTGSRMSPDWAGLQSMRQARDARMSGSLSASCE